MIAACSSDKPGKDDDTSTGGAGGDAGGDRTTVGEPAGAAGGSDMAGGTGGSPDVTPEGGQAGELAEGGNSGAAQGGAGGAPSDVVACEPPDWTLGGTPDVDDPRWQEATGVSFPNLLAEGAIAAKSRLVESVGTLFLQLRILVDAAPGNIIAPNGTTFYRDSVYVAFADATLATIQVVRVAIDGTGATHATRWLKSGGTWTSGPAGAGAPVWLTGLTAWVNPPVSGSEQVSWAVNFKIATASVPGAKFWYAPVISPGAIGTLQIYAWPNRGGFVEPNPPDTGAIASTWGQQFDAIGAANWGDYTASLAKSCSP